MAQLKYPLCPPETIRHAELKMKKWTNTELYLNAIMKMCGTITRENSIFVGLNNLCSAIKPPFGCDVSKFHNAELRQSAVSFDFFFFVLFNLKFLCHLRGSSHNQHKFVRAVAFSRKYPPPICVTSFVNIGVNFSLKRV